MSIYRAFFTLFLILFANMKLQAQETTTIINSATPTITSPAPSPTEVKGRPMIITPVPSVKEEIATPEGYVNCFTIAAGWYKNAWIPEHRVCQYDNVPGQTVAYEGVAWVGSYWACTQYTGTACTGWEWKPGHWVKTLEVY